MELDNNDRQPFGYSILNMRNGENGLAPEIVGTYNPLSQQLFTYTKDLLWPDGSNEIPGDTRDSSHDCLYPDEEYESFFNGEIAFATVCAILGVLVGALTYTFYRKYWNAPIQMLIAPVEIKIFDYILLITVLTDALQSLGKGPDISKFNSLLSMACSYSSAEIREIISLQDGNYFIGVIIVDI
jgi:hypothetical protein